MQPLLRWKKILPFRTMGAGPGPASISGQLRQLLFAAGLLLALLIIAQLGALTVNRMISTRLVEQRIIPMGQLQTINSAYQTSWAIADKVQTGTIDKAGGGTALHDIRTALGEDRRELESGRRSEENTYYLKSLIRFSYAVICLKTKNRHTQQ